MDSPGQKAKEGQGGMKMPGACRRSVLASTDEEGNI